MKTERIFVSGILLIYWHPVSSFAPTVSDHIDSFEKYSRFNVWKVNTAFGFPSFLRKFEFAVTVLHYSPFGGSPFAIDEDFLEYIGTCANSYKVAFFQDEYRYWPQRSQLDARCHLDCIYTLIEKKYIPETYGQYTHAGKIITVLPGYVSEDLETKAKQWSKPMEMRRIDVGYRARPLPFYMGKGAQEKRLIGDIFKARSKPTHLAVDIETREEKRIYGNDWYRFIGNCKFVLGVESGVSIFDFDGQIQARYEIMTSRYPGISFEDVSEKLLKPHENKIPYRTISPRHFEAAAFRTCQILFAGDYSGIMKPGIHYIELKKDFSNFDDVLDQMKSSDLVQRIVENTHRDLIGSKRYTYRRFMESFDDQLHRERLNADIPAKLIRLVDNAFRVNRMFRIRKVVNCWGKEKYRKYRYRHFWGRSTAVRILKALAPFNP